MSRRSPYLSPGPHSFRTHAGATLTYFVTGTGERVLVNVAPGWGCASVLYQHSLGFLSQPQFGFTLVHLEVRGTRGSTAAEDRMEMGSWYMAEDLESLRLHLGLSTLDVLGHANGGCIALWYAIRFPARIRRLVLVSPQLLGTTELETEAAAARERLLAARVEEQAVDCFRREQFRNLRNDEQLAQAIRSIMPLYLARPERDLDALRELIALVAPQITCWRAQTAIDQRKQFEDQAEQLSSVRAHTLIIVGQEDLIYPVVVAQRVAKGVRGSSLRVLDDSAHFPWIEQRDSFSRTVLAFYS